VPGHRLVARCVCGFRERWNLLECRQRVDDDTASARSLPSLISGSAAPNSAKPMFTWPAAMSASLAENSGMDMRNVQIELLFHELHRQVLCGAGARTGIAQRLRAFLHELDELRHGFDGQRRIDDQYERRLNVERDRDEVLIGRKFIDLNNTG